MNNEKKRALAVPKKSTDSIQNKLREDKANWNSQCSQLISRLISFKKGLNGRGDAKAGLPVSNIKDPLPHEIPSLLQEIASEFQKLVGEASSIISEQESYSRNRRKPAPKTSSIKEGSNKLTRGLTYLNSLVFNNETNRYRVSLIKLLVDLERNLKELENIILALNMDNIPTAIKKYQTVKYKLSIIKDLIENIRKKQILNQPQVSKLETATDIKEPNVSERIKPTEKTPTVNVEENTSEKLKVDNITKDLLNSIDLDIPNDLVLKLRKLIKSFNAVSDENKKSLIFARIEEEYEELINKINSAMSEKYNASPVKSLQEAHEIVSNLATQARLEYQLEKTSANALTRLLKRTLLKTINRNPTSELRLQVSQEIERFIKEVNQTMDSLQNSFDATEMISAIKRLDEFIEKLNPQLNILNSMYKDYSFSNEEGKSKHRKSLYDNVLDRKIKRDLESEF